MVKLDLKDRKLLYWLDKDSRATNKELGRQVGLTEQAIGYRIKRLQNEGVIKAFVTFLNTLQLGYKHYKVFIRLHNTTDAIETQIIESLIKNANIRWVVTTSGKYDLSFSVLAQSELDFIKIYQSIEREYSNYVLERNISMPVDSLGYTREYLINGSSSKELEYRMPEEAVKIDETDKKILKTISQDARKNVVAIAKEIGSTIDVVQYRLKKLQKNRVINAFTMQIDLEKLGYEYYTIFFHLYDVTKETDKAIRGFAKSHPGILYLVRVIGNYDLQFDIEVENYQALEKILKEFRQQFSKNIHDFEILKVKKEYKYNFYPF